MLLDILSEKNLPYTSAIGSLIAALAALAAWYVTWREVRRCNRVIVRLRKFTSSYKSTLQGNTYELEIWIRNGGVQMQDISVALGFDGPGKSGSFHLPIPLSDRMPGVRSTFLRGTTASFVLSSTDQQSCRMLGALRDIAEQRPVINVFNNSFLACTFPLHRRFDWIRRLWNKLSFRFAFNRRVGEGHGGKGVFKRYQLPYFEVRSEKLRFFLDGVGKGTSPDDSGMPPARPGKAPAQP